MVFLIAKCFLLTYQITRSPANDTSLMAPHRSIPLILASFLCCGTLFARATPKADAVSPLTTKEILMPGEFEWQPDRSPEGEVFITVDLSRQMLEVFRGNVLIARSTISSGGYGHSTPNGSFNILGKEAMHYSNLYHHAPMPFMQRLTMYGVALHAGYLPGVPASHGCIRLPNDFAKRLFEITSCGNLVTVTGNAKEYRQPTAQNTRNRSKKEKPAEVTPVDSSGTHYLASEATPPPAAKTQRVEKVALAPAQPTAQNGSKSMAELESEELDIRNNPNLNRTERQVELNKVWAAQRALMGRS